MNWLQRLITRHIDQFDDIYDRSASSGQPSKLNSRRRPDAVQIDLLTFENTAGYGGLFPKQFRVETGVCPDITVKCKFCIITFGSGVT